MGLGALCTLERFNKSEPLYMLCMFTSAACSFVYPFTSKPIGILGIPNKRLRVQDDTEEK